MIGTILTKQQLEVLSKNKKYRTNDLGYVVLKDAKHFIPGNFCGKQKELNISSKNEVHNNCQIVYKTGFIFIEAWMIAELNRDLELGTLEIE